VHSDFEACYRAIRSRDPRFDGRFVTGVRTTGVYCRPVCPAPTPLRRNVRFLPSAAAAEREGLRPCRRCRPEQAPAPDHLPPDLLRALRLVEEGFLDDAPVTALAAAVHLSPRQLRRAFTTHLGASPREVARVRRVHSAARLVDATDLPVAEVAQQAGYRSLRRFNQEFRDTYRMSPRDMRAGRRPRRDPDVVRVRLAARPPLDAAGMLAFLRGRCVPGVEEVADGAYRRVALAAGLPVRVTLRPRDTGVGFLLEAPAAAAPALSDLVARARRLLDLDADPAAVDATLAPDPLLAPLVARRPGLRVPGAWDPFETAVRAVLGQQVSVAAATTLAGRVAARLGTPVAAPDGGLLRAFPTPDAVAAGDLDGLGVTGARIRALRGLAAGVRDGAIRLDAAADPDATRAALLEVPGIGPWTADVIRMRAMRDPDAFPVGDLGLRRRLEAAGLADPAAALARAEAWRPWRAYAALHLWTDDTGGTP
jgi:AraC family transcriptional regulator, regulatory protein of adaptative response / DNA-3-methyladenine glycosylase II